MKQFILISLALITGLSSCNTNTNITGVRAKGAAYEIAVIVDKNLWDNTVGDIIKAEITAPLPYLLQEESSMRYTYLTPDYFERSGCYVRNLLLVNINKSLFTKVAVQKSLNDYAIGQAVIRINAPDVQAFENYLTENKGELLKFYDKEEMRRGKEALEKKYSYFVMDKVMQKFGISLSAPSDIVKFKESEDGLWFSNDARKGRTDILVYSFPFTDKNTFSLEYLVAKRDSIAKVMVPGSFDGSYMSTEKRVVDYYGTMLNGKYCGVLKGLWRMEGGDMMGGPFVSYARIDEVNNRVIVTEGFVYEPRVDKKQYIRRIEAALHTLRMPNELDPGIESEQKAIATDVSTKD